MNLRCRPGDLAVIVGGDRFISHIVRITRRCAIYADHWDTDPPKYVPGYLLPCSFADCTLRPIRPDAEPVERDEPVEASTC